MCDQCEIRDADPRSRAFLTMGLLEVLSKGDHAKCLAGQSAYVVCSGVQDAVMAEALAATMALTDQAVQAAQVRRIRVCMN